jgi:peptide-methionine (S)-S-oxide reductase
MHQQPPATETATFAAGCFWGIEAEFRREPGVLRTCVGYMGGHIPNATYEQVCGGRTGHAEVVQLQFDPARISYEQLLAIFFAIHDPTTLNRQGPDVGSQYRSAIFFHSEVQRLQAWAARDAVDAGRRWRRPVVTEIVAATDLSLAEEYHQQYLEKRGMASCRIG